MCSRGSLGYPFLVGEIEHYLRTGEKRPTPTVAERLTCAQEHLQALWDYKGQRGLYQARKHLAWYCKDFPGAATLREQLSRVESVAVGHALLDQAIRVNLTPGYLGKV